MSSSRKENGFVSKSDWEFIAACTLASIPCAIIASISVNGFERVTCNILREWWSSWVFNQPYLFTFLVSCLIGYGIGKFKPIKLITTPEIEESLLYKKLTKLMPIKGLYDKYVMITLSNRKVYVGHLIDANLSDTNGCDDFLEIIPVMSGFRKQNNGQVAFTTFYWNENGLLRTNGEEIRMLFSYTNVLQISPFDMNLYINHF